MQQISIFSPAMSLGPAGPSQDRADFSPHRGRADARELAERVSRAWHAEHMPDGIRVPVGVIASLSQLADAPGTEAALRALAPEALWRLLERVWAVRWIEQPELASWAAPLHQWLMIQPSLQQARSVAAVTHAALDAGLLQLTGTQDAQARREADPLGAVLTTLRSKGARQANAEEHTPSDVAELMARLALGPDLPVSGSLCEPTAGTGGLFRAAASQAAQAGREVHAFEWAMNDVDPLAAASCASNALTWDLGPNVLVGCSDVLVTPDWVSTARRERAQIRTRHAREVADARALAGLRALMSGPAPEAGQASPPLGRGD
ncbi:hypothetical protein ACICHK_00145 [Streptomyces sp. AHU1]|uniref:hypothetical protein n=1 Tax=Streptomyces sp. AHU1 TaxID=3377215 RepID=UPI003877E2E4